MWPVILKLIATLTMAAEVDAAIATVRGVHRHLSDDQRAEYSYYIAEASIEHNVDPLLVAAVMWHESDFRNLRVNRTNDWGLMQVHWQRLNVKVGEDWLVGLTKKDLLDPKKNIHAGVRELVYLRRFCDRKGHTKRDHNWWAHYKHGVVVSSRRYDRKILWRYKKLVRSRDKNRS